MNNTYHHNPQHLVILTSIDMTDKAHHNNQIHVSGIQLKLLPFWPVDPQVWFTQVEGQFTIKDITAQKKKYDNIVTSLAPKFVMILFATS